MEHLYQLTDQYRFLERDIEEGEDIFGAMEVELKGIQDKIEDKAENVAKFILSLEGEGEMIQAEERRLINRRSAILNRAAWLRDYLLRELLAVKVEKIKREVVTISVRDNPPSVKVVQEDLIPHDYRRVIPETWEPDKKAIIDQFKDTGEIVGGVEIIVDKKSLQIR